MRSVLLAVMAATLMVVGVWAQPAPDAEGDQERLEQERARDFREMARQQRAGQAGVQVWGMAVDGPGRMMPMGGPGQQGGVPEQLIVPGGDVRTIFVVRGYTLHAFTFGVDGLEMRDPVDLRSDEEIERAEQAGEGAFIWPDPAMVPLSARWDARSASLFVLRGGILRQYSSDLEMLSEFDLRTEREKQGGPRIQVRMQPGPPGAPPPAPPAPEEAAPEQ